MPLSTAAAAAVAADSNLIEAVLTGGDDYEILFTVAPERRDSVIEGAKAVGLAVAEIGIRSGAART